MDCEAVRERIEDGEPEPVVQEHLWQCAACQAEWQFSRRLAAAVAAMPRERAPRELAGRVMGRIAAQRPSVRAPERLTWLSLRPWEMGWLVAACVLLIVGAGMLAPWQTWGSAWLSTGLSGRIGSLVQPAGAGALLRSMGLGLAAALPSLDLAPAAWTGSAMAWACGAAGFALALFSLLSWHDRAAAAPDWEEAHG